MIFIVFLNYYRGCCLKICSHMMTSRDKGLYILNHNTMVRQHAFSIITQRAGKSPSQSTHLHRALETLQAVPEHHHFSTFLWSAVCRTSQKQSSSGRQVQLCHMGAQIWQAAGISPSFRGWGGVSQSLSSHWSCTSTHGEGHGSMPTKKASSLPLFPDNLMHIT